MDQSNPTQLKECGIVGCIQCAEDASVCTCQENQFYHISQTNTLSPKVCYDKIEDSGPGYGKDGANKELKKCSVEGCGDCLDDYQVCKACDQGKWYIPPTQGNSEKIEACYDSPLRIPIGYGASALGSHQLQPCVVENCSNCRKIYKECLSCLPSFYHKQETPITQCFDEKSIPNNLSKNEGSMVLLSLR